MARLPRAVETQLREFLRCNTFRNLALLHELLELLKLFSKHGIPALPFKGPVLALTVYQDVSLREFLDLDILVQHDHVFQATTLLRSSGYRLLLPLSEPALLDTIRAKHTYHLGFVRKNGDVSVEVHWRFMQGRFFFRPDTGRIWNRRVEVPMRGFQVRCLHAEDTLLILCIHGWKHHWRRLSWICDIAALIERSPMIDWRDVLKSAQEAGARRRFLLGAGLARAVLSSTIPLEICSEIEADSELCAAIAQIARFSSPPTGGPSFLRLFDEFRYHLGTCDGLRDSVEVVWHFIRQAATPTDQDFSFVSLRNPPHFLYYLLRPFRLAAKYFRNSR
jgi:hypothetical protein